MTKIHFVLVLMAGLLAGCASGPQLIAPGRIETIRPAVTNLQTGQVTPAVMFTNQAIAPWIENTLRNLDTGASAAGLPWAHTATTAALGLAGLVLGWKNRKARQSLATAYENTDKTWEALEHQKSVAETLVDNFETLREAALTVPGYAEIDHKIMTAVQLAQVKAGSDVGKTIGQMVLAQTAGTTSDKA
jgi:hypothetical protein